MDVHALLALGPVIPVVVIQDAGEAVELARCLVAGNIRAMEVTLRTDAALDAIARIRDGVPEAVVGVGTVQDPGQLHAAIGAGARFAVSPGLTGELALAARSAEIPFLPGVATASEVMQARAHGFLVQKFFPAEAAGGTAVLKSWHGPFPDVTFCPTGGINAANAADYLALPNVACVGGSWLTPQDALRKRRWDEITALARATRSLGA